MNDSSSSPGAGEAGEGRNASNELHDFEVFLEQRDLAARAYVNGNAGPLGEMTTDTSPATFFGPQGGHISGAEHVWRRYESDARHFDPESESQSRFEIFDAGASGGLAYWTGYQHATVHFRGKPEPVEFHLRVTEIFRREKGTWKLVHRHADPLVKES